MADPMKSILAQWRQCCPELDTSSMEIAGRILLAASLLQTRLEPVFRRHDVSSGGFDVLATLRRQGPPFELSPTILYKELLITSGTMTHRLNTLEKQGLIERITHPSDRRGLLVRLPPEIPRPWVGYWETGLKVLRAITIKGSATISCSNYSYLHLSPSPLNLETTWNRGQIAASPNIREECDLTSIIVK